MDIQFERPIHFDDANSVAQWTWLQLSKIEESFNLGPKFLILSTSYKEPAKRKNGMVVLADGTSWNPGAGAGFYGRYGAAWVKLG